MLQTETAGYKIHLTPTTHNREAPGRGPEAPWGLPGGGIGPRQPGPSMSLSIAQLLERSRRELLDLSTRNRLLSMPVGATSARWVEVRDELGDQVYRMLAVDRRVFGFLPGVPPESGRRRSRGGDGTEGAEAAGAVGKGVAVTPGKVSEAVAATVSGEDEGLDEGSEGVDLPPPEEPEEEPAQAVGPRSGKGSGSGAAPAVPARRHVDARLQTLLTPEALQRRLLDLYRDARTMIEEQGVNILYLAVGQLKWIDPAEPAVALYAPLILVPVDLARRTASDRFQLSRREEEIQDNLSLAAKLKADFGVTLPEIGDEEEFDPVAFAAAVARAVREREGWEVLPNAMVLGFFSFAKFLMYRDLDPASWPEPDRLLQHPLVAGLLQEGFSGGEPPVAEDVHLDDWIPVGRLDHVVDADGSQTLAIEAVRQGRSVVIQGPPGTGKSQSIANVIATAVLDGKRVLFVAEKLAALEVVKRRLEKEGLGPLCLELHSNKASKRAVVEEIGATWKLGRPRAVDGETLLARLEGLRDALNRHARDLQAPHAASGLTPFRIFGEYLGLGERGVLADGVELAFEGLESWTAAEHEARRRLTMELAKRVEEIGVPRRHPWRGVRRHQVQKLDFGPLATRIRGVVVRVEAVREAARALSEVWGEAPAGSLAGLERQHREASHAAAAPRGMDRASATHEVWGTGTGEGRVSALVGHGTRFATLSGELADRVTEAVWLLDYRALRVPLAAHGASWLRLLNGDFRRALKELRGGWKGDVPTEHEERLAVVDRIIEGQAAHREILRGDALGRGAFGSAWDGPGTAWPLAGEVVAWMERGRELGLGADFRGRFAAVGDPTRLGGPVGALRTALDAARAELGLLGGELQLDWGAAFAEAAGGLEAVDLAGLRERAEVWLERMEELGAWCPFHSRATEARSAGLGSLVERLETGEVPAPAAGDVFERTRLAQLLRDVYRERPELAGFDGLLHEERVGEFRQLDRERLGLARHRTLAAHFERLPPVNSAVGAAGIVRGELERKRGHRAVRRLLRDAGTVVQAIKPVFMMSPLSVAQYLEPGAVEFDLLVIDEASQVQPVDALGAVARCRQIVVVGDSRQLPPTRFFARLTSSEPLEGEGKGEDGGGAAAEAGDIESILGLCCARGLPQMMLRWHYRSRHHSLIAVSNREFYDNRLFIVPSPYASEAGLGLKFHHVPDGVFDSGGTGANRVEAKVVCREILRHACRTPGASLGVAAFSVRQQQAILDELELLRRENPDAESFFTAHPTEPFFVKNLENVQGDERDVIFISVGYGRDVQGTLAMRFGPLAVEGGERRLNVLISRAKRRCEVFASLTADEIDLSRSPGRGVAALKTFLAFAQSGRLETGAPEGGSGSDPGIGALEEAVRKAVEAMGYEVRTRVGIAGFFIDLAVLDPARREEGRYLMGIELDGPGYWAARSARDRDRLRPAVLTDHGWLLYRIWSGDWFQRPKEQARKLRVALEQARAAAAAAAAAAEAAETETETAALGGGMGRVSTPGEEEKAQVVPVEREEGEMPGESGLAIPYREAQLEVPRDREPHLLPTRALADILWKVVEVEGPVHEDELVTRVRSLWELGRAGARVQDAVAKAVRALVVSKECLREQGFLTVPGARVPVRNRAGTVSPNLRKAEFLPPAEVREAVQRLVSAHHGARSEELPVAVARLLGFRHTSAALRGLVREQVARWVGEGRMEETGGMVRMTGGNGLT